MYNESILRKVKKPYQYIGGELYSFSKKWNECSVKIAFAFPDKYEIGASNLGQRILYTLVNKKDGFLADRVYAPDIDFKEELEKNKIPLLTLESKKKLSEFDFVGFSLQYELAYPTVLKMLDLSGIEVLRKYRDNEAPIVMAGGPCCFNAAPMEDFIDVFFIGDGEDSVPELLEVYEQNKDKNLSRNDLLKLFSDIAGVYVPEYPKNVSKRISDLAFDTVPVCYPIPYSQSVHDRAIVEIRRGCGRMCRFCQPGHVTLPIRERSADDVIKLVKEMVSNTGYDEYSLLSLSSNDYSNITPVIEELNSFYEKDEVSVSLPSQRIDRYSTKLADLVHKIRKSTITLAPEAGSQRLRDVINKNITREQILETTLNCYRSGYSKIKFYFIAGLPTETKKDLDEMIDLLSEILYEAKKIKKELSLSQPLNITCTVSIFVPKPFTPFQYAGQNSLDNISEKLSYLKEKAKDIKGLKINYHDRFISQIEAVLTRGDASLSKYIYELYKSGSYLDSWDENFSRALWADTAEKLGINLDLLASKTYEKDDILPWHFINVGINETWFWQEYQKALQAKNQLPCEFNCVNCGVCSNLSVKQKRDNIYSPVLTKRDETFSEVYKYRIKLSKSGKLKYISHLDWQNTVVKLLRRANVDLVFSQGFNPIPKISLGIALPIFIESDVEFLDFSSRRYFEEEKLFNILSETFKEISTIKSVQMLSKEALPIDLQVQWAEFEIKYSNETISNFDSLVYIKDKLLDNENLFVIKKNKKGVEKKINVKKSLKSVVYEDNSLRLILKTGQNQDIPLLRPDELIGTLADLESFTIRKIRVFDINLNEL